MHRLPNKILCAESCISHHGQLAINRGSIPDHNHEVERWHRADHKFTGNYITFYHYQKIDFPIPTGNTCYLARIDLHHPSLLPARTQENTTHEAEKKQKLVHDVTSS
jgi:hypothetical protein